jgi:hypothetical protein
MHIFCRPEAARPSVAFTCGLSISFQRQPLHRRHEWGGIICGLDQEPPPNRLAEVRKEEQAAGSNRLTSRASLELSI